MGSKVRIQNAYAPSNPRSRELKRFASQRVTPKDTQYAKNILTATVKLIKALVPCSNLNLNFNSVFLLFKASSDSLIVRYHLRKYQWGSNLIRRSLGWSRIYPLWNLRNFVLIVSSPMAANGRKIICLLIVLFQVMFSGYSLLF